MEFESLRSCVNIWLRLNLRKRVPSVGVGGSVPGAGVVAGVVGKVVTTVVAAVVLGPAVEAAEAETKTIEHQ